MSDETRANATVFDYLRWRGDLTLAQDGFNEVDSLILCIISYINLKKLRQLWSFDPKDAMPMGDVCRQLTEEDEQLGLSTLDYIPLMRAAAETARFRDVSLFAFESLHDEAQQMQFAAVSFLLPDGSVYVAYRGTDMTIVGWQEDFNMSFLSAVPAQLKATEYAEAVARAAPGAPCASADTPREEIWRPGRRSTWTKSSSASGSSPPTTTTAPASAGTW